MDIPSPSSGSPSGRSDTPTLEQGRHVPMQRRTSRPSEEHEVNFPDGRGEEGENEQSPLLQPRASDEVGKVPHLPGMNENVLHAHNMAFHREDTTRIPNRSFLYLFCLTACFFGLQVAWSVEQAEISPFLLDLGLSRKIMALIWIAGPVSGMVVQPYVGMRSDGCTSRFGKRRPFIVGGAIATIVSLMILVWSADITGAILQLFGVPKESTGTRTTSIVVASIMLYVLDFSINVLQASARALVVDSAPREQQDIANAWATLVSGVGDIMGFTFGYLNLGRYLSALGDTQFKDLAFLTSVALVVSVSITVFTIKERKGRVAERLEKQGQGLLSFFKHLGRRVKTLPRQIKVVCQVQIAAWIGWFPILFYTSTWIRDIYLVPYIEKDPTAGSDPELRENGTRQGALGLLLKAITYIVCIIVFPWLARKIPVITLKRLWIGSHILFALLTGLTFLVDSVPSAIVISAAMGVPWSITLWVPFALIAAETKSGAEEDETGVIFGIHNMAIAMPQVIAIAASSLIFLGLENEHGIVKPDTTAWVFRFGGLCALVAAALALRVHEEEI